MTHYSWKWSWQAEQGRCCSQTSALWRRTLKALRVQISKLGCSFPVDGLETHGGAETVHCGVHSCYMVKNSMNTSINTLKSLIIALLVSKADCSGGNVQTPRSWTTAGQLRRWSHFEQILACPFNSLHPTCGVCTWRQWPLSPPCLVLVGVTH